MGVMIPNKVARFLWPTVYIRLISQVYDGFSVKLNSMYSLSIEIIMHPYSLLPRIYCYILA